MHGEKILKFWGCFAANCEQPHESIGVIRHTQTLKTEFVAELRRISGHTEAGVCRRDALDVGYHLTDPTTSF
jgi:hypothetical protein